MSATDKEQHTDTEKATEKTESDRSSNSVNNALDVEAVLVPDLPEREETVGAGEADRGQSVGTSSDSTPPTTIEESQASQSLYFQVRRRPLNHMKQKAINFQRIIVLYKIQPR